MQEMIWRAHTLDAPSIAFPKVRSLKMADQTRLADAFEQTNIDLHSLLPHPPPPETVAVNPLLGMVIALIFVFVFH